MAVRRERVIFEAVDRYTADVAKMAAATKLLQRELKSADTDTAKFQRSVDQLSQRSLPDMSRRLDTSSASIDRYSGRLGLLAKGLGALGPAAVPITTAVVPALAMLTSGLSAAVLGMGVTVTAFQGVGDALEAVNKAQLEPTAKNINAAREAMQAISPAAREAVRAMQEWRPVLREIRDAAAGGFFPGFVDGLDKLESAAPQVERLFAVMGDASGDVFNDMAGWVSGPGGTEFLSFLETEAPAALTKFATAAGNVGAGLAELMMAMDPLSDFGLDGLVDATERFQQWADGLTQTDGYAEFIDYVRETGPQVAETVGSLANGILQVAEAAAPLGGPILQGIEAFADAVAAIADSPLGPPIMAAVTAMSALSLATKLFGATAGMSFAQARTGLAAYTASLRGVNGAVAQAGAAKTGAKAAGGVALIGGALVASNAGLEMQNTLMLASIGMMAGPWGAAAGAAAGAAMDLAAALDDDASAAIEEFQARLDASRGDMEALVNLRADLQATQGNDDAGLWGNIKDGLTDSKGELAKPILEDTKKQIEALAEAQLSEAQAAGFATRAEYEHASALMAVHDAALRAANSELNWKQSLLDASKTVRENGRVVDEHGNALKGHEQAAIDSEKAILAIGAAWNEQARAGDGTRKELETTRATMRRMARQAGFGEAAIRDMIGALDAVPPKTDALITVNSAGARAEAIALGGIFDNLVRPRTLTISTQYSGYGSDLGNILAGPMGPAPKKKKADGGPIYGPGTATSDSIPAMLSNGEYVIRAAAVARYGVGFFDRANQMRLASGGSVGGGHHDSSGVRSLGEESRKSAKELREEREERRKARRERAIQRAEDKVQRARSLLQDRVSERDQFGASIADRFRSDIFASSSDRGSGWFTSSAPKSDWRSKLTADIKQAREVKGLQSTLRKKGLDKGAAEALFADADVETLREFAGMTPKQIAEYEALFNQRESLLGAAGAGAGEAAFGGGVRDARGDLKKAQNELRALRRRRRDNYRHRDRYGSGRRDGNGRSGDGGGTQVDIWVQGDSSRDPLAMAHETARRLAFEGG